MKDIISQKKVEDLASVQHDIWSHWMKYLFLQCEERYGDVVIPRDKIIKWHRQMITPYSELSEKEKESDREQVKKLLKVM